jgi:hypothetical protein
VDPIERAERTSELVYGTLTALIALAGVEVAGLTSPTRAGAIILIGAIATWFAHAYAAVLGRRAALGRPASTVEIAHALRSAWPIVLAALPSFFAVAGARLGWWSGAAAVIFSNVAGIAVLAAAGWLASQAAGEGLRGRLGSSIVTASFGLGIVALELLIHQ